MSGGILTRFGGDKAEGSKAPGQKGRSKVARKKDIMVILADMILQAIALGFGAGVMLAATSFSLIVPGKDAAISQGASQMNAALIMGVGVLLGTGEWHLQRVQCSL